MFFLSFSYIHHATISVENVAVARMVNRCSSPSHREETKQAMINPREVPIETRHHVKERHEGGTGREEGGGRVSVDKTTVEGL